MKYFVYPYVQTSRSAKALAEELGGKRVLRTGSMYKYADDHLLINWGCGECPHPQALNREIMDLIDKVRFFKRLKGTGLTPDYATTSNDAKKLGYPVFCRTMTQGHDGKGIVVADCDGHVVSAPLYVKGIDKTSEYRVHVGRGYDGVIEILGASKKLKKAVSPEMTNVPVDPRIWCGETTVFGDFMSKNGLPMEVQSVVTQVMLKFPELTFAAFDVVHDNSEGKAYVIEGNSAPMATPETTKAYALFFAKYAEAIEAERLAKFAKIEPVVEAQPVPVAVADAAAPARSREDIVSDISRGIAELIQSCFPVQQ